MRFGLEETVISKKCGALARFPEVDRAILYGSRAKGDFKAGSHIDLALQGALLHSDVVSKISAVVDDLNLPYSFGFRVLDTLDGAALREHIERVGQTFYEKNGSN